ncbi:MAG: rod shape-determining protein MreC [Planctomycetes bacterium]|nr:rod shape-determining protein MreC [Planctomycetota bacterium]
MTHPRIVYAALFFLFACLVVLLPARWTGPARSSFVGLLAPLERFARSLLALDGGSAAPTAPAKESAEVASLRAQNADLRAALISAQAETLDLRRKVQALAQLSETGFRDVPLIVLAPVLTHRDASNWHRTLFVGRGSTDGIQPSQPVVWGRSLLGKVVEAGPSGARVRLLTDPAFRMKVLLVPDAPAGKDPVSVSGLLQGTGQEDCEVVWVLRDCQVRTGWSAVSMEEEEGAWPRGLAVGRVREVSDDYGSYLRIKVRPDLDPSTLDSVCVLKLARH